MCAASTGRRHDCTRPPRLTVKIFLPRGGRPDMTRFGYCWRMRCCRFVRQPAAHGSSGTPPRKTTLHRPSRAFAISIGFGGHPEDLVRGVPDAQDSPPCATPTCCAAWALAHSARRIRLSSVVRWSIWFAPVVIRMILPGSSSRPGSRSATGSRMPRRKRVGGTRCCPV